MAGLGEGCECGLVVNGPTSVEDADTAHRASAREPDCNDAGPQRRGRGGLGERCATKQADGAQRASQTNEHSSVPQLCPYPRRRMDRLFVAEAATAAVDYDAKRN